MDGSKMQFILENCTFATDEEEQQTEARLKAFKAKKIKEDKNRTGSGDSMPPVAQLCYDDVPF